MEYKVVELEDMSTGAKRVSAKVLVDLDRSNKEEIEKFILQVIEELRYEKVESPKTLAKHGSKPFEVVYLYLYKNIDEKNHGLPLARASYINADCRVKPLHFSDEFIDANTTIKYDSTYEALNGMVEENKVSDDEFLKRLKEHTEKLEKIFDIIRVNMDDYELLAKELEIVEPELRGMLDENFIGFPNDKYLELYRNHQNLLASLSNIGVAVQNKAFNNTQKSTLVTINFESAEEAMKNLEQS